MDSRECSLKALSRKKAESQPSQEKGQPSGPASPAMAWGPPGAQSSSQQEQTQDWRVEKPQCQAVPGVHGSPSTEAVQSFLESGRRNPGPAPPLTPPSPQDLAQIVAQLVSEDVDKDVLFPHPPRSSESANAFQAFLVRSKPFWHNVALEAPASRSPPS
ncbi:hypothetical protein K5549_009789 [Capra hircus]|nr:hypothetical protein K5549_009789 [Capra hircus]